MTRHRRSAGLVGALAILIGLGSAPARADALVVAEARGAALQAGQTIDAGQAIKLLAGQRLTLIAANGAIIKLTGPFDGVPDPDGQRTGSVADALLKLTSQTTQSSSTLGAVRAPETAPPEPWLVAIASSGHRCVEDGRPVVLWRPAAAAEQQLAISRSITPGKPARPGRPGADRLTLPPNFPAQDDQGYVMAIGSMTSTVTLHLMPAAFDRDVMRVAWLMDKGCTAQARLLAASVK
ncbi:MAG: hypothetical protein WDO24_17005 [Pseudomonadota bacterium]